MELRAPPPKKCWSVLHSRVAFGYAALMKSKPTPRAEHEWDYIAPDHVRQYGTDFELLPLSAAQTQCATTGDPHAGLVAQLQQRAIAGHCRSSRHAKSA